MPAAGTRTRRRAATRQVALLGLAVGLIVLAVVFYSYLSAEEPAPDDQYVGFYCPDCDHYFEISHREFERRTDANEIRFAEDGRLRVRCDECGNFTAGRANRPPVGEE